MGGFKDFILRGNVVDLAVGVVIGGAFGGVVTAFTKDLLTPVIAAVAGKPDFSALEFTVNGSKFLIGDFINARMKKPEAPAPPATKSCPECLSEIPLAAKRCSHCTVALAA
jgi:large conductance mechanosensitive channel